jgi:diaminohydroxyphosphoribosylaminopyrimidine deaminase/5-amino-6-(5-phosphoribosylamino)uracil reductase
VHELRHECDAILVGAGTALADDPLLTDRSGRERHRPLVRVVLDSELRLSTASQLAQTARETPVIIYASAHADAAREAALAECGVEVMREKGDKHDLQELMCELARRSIQSVLVEGGATVAGALLDASLVDKLSFFIAPLIIGGRDAPTAIGGTGAERIRDAVNLRDIEITQHGRDLEITGYPRTVTSVE